MAAFILGVVAGGYLFAKTQPRSFLSVQSCDHCLGANELTGLAGSVLVNQAPLLLKPVVVLETDKTVAIKNPRPEASFDYVIIPKKDIKDVGELSEADKSYLVDAYAVIEQLIQKYHLRSYQVLTYGPDLQTVRYLHFHLEAGK